MTTDPFQSTGAAHGDAPSVFAATGAWGLWVHVALFALGSLASMFVVLVAATVVLFLAVGADPGALAEAALHPWFLGFTSIAQILGIGLVSAALAVRFRSASPEPRPTLGHVAGLRGSAWPWYAVALLGGLTVWTFPSWLAAELTRLIGWESTVTAVTEALTGPLTATWPLVLAVVVSAPIAEELIFRGYLFTVAERAMSGVAAFVFTTVVFAAYHLDPVHVLALLPTAAFFGVLRWRSGSIGPPMVAHFVNNGIGVVAAMLAGEVGEPVDELSVLPALAGLAFTAALTAVVWWGSERAPR